MTSFIHDNFILNTESAKRLYHFYAKDLPIIDYHCHLNPKEIAEDKQFDNLTDIWLKSDHYKWRAMRANGINETYITGNASDYEKFEKWAETVPYSLRNPLYHWTHLELNRPFGITTLLNPSTAREIYDDVSAKLRTSAFSVRNIMRNWKVEVVCTTDDPIDSLEYHQQIKKDNFEIKVLPTWRPDKVMMVDDPTSYNQYLDKLETVASQPINSYADLLLALNKRQQYFADHGCRLSDHGMERFYAEEYNEEDIANIFAKIRTGSRLSENEADKIKSALMVDFGRMNHAFGWVQQFHYGPLRNVNTRKVELIGEACGFDSMGDYNVAKDLGTFLNRLEKLDQLTKTIIYNINPKDNNMIATMIGNFQDGKIAGKIQFGSGWWFLDQKNGMEEQMNCLSNHGLLSRFIGMLTDSRSFLSYSRHEYFRRVLCNLLGNDMEKGLIPMDFDLVGKMVQDISYYNAKEYFKF
jgi:glucuronate isomerase